MSLRKRLVSNGFASAGSIAWSALAQLISVPILTLVWGAERYGEWLMLITIPTYFALSDLGFTAAATADMTMANARGDRRGVSATFQSIWALVLWSSLILLLLASPLLWLSNRMVEGSEWWSRYGNVLFLLVAYSAAVLCSRVVLSGFRSTGNYAIGTLIYDAIQFLEAALALAAAYFGADFVVCAGIYLLVRVFNFVIGYIVMVKLTPWLRLGFRDARAGEIKRLVAPAFSALAIPTALSMNLQGMVLVAGYVVGPAAVAFLGPVRTASRITIQLIGVVNRATMPEFSSAVATKDTFALVSLIKLNVKSIALVLVPGALAFGFFGSGLVRFWSFGRIDPSAMFVSLIALSMLIHGIWFFASNLLVSINKHGRFGRFLLPASFCGVLVAFPLAMFGGLNGIALAIVISELLVVFIMWPDLKKTILEPILNGR